MVDNFNKAGKAICGLKSGEERDSAYYLKSALSSITSRAASLFKRSAPQTLGAMSGVLKRPQNTPTEKATSDNTTPLHSGKPPFADYEFSIWAQDMLALTNALFSTLISCTTGLKKSVGLTDAQQTKTILERSMRKNYDLNHYILEHIPLVGMSVEPVALDISSSKKDISVTSPMCLLVLFAPPETLEKEIREHYKNEPTTRIITSGDFMRAFHYCTLSTSVDAIANAKSLDINIKSITFLGMSSTVGSEYPSLTHVKSAVVQSTVWFFANTARFIGAPTLHKNTRLYNTTNTDSHDWKETFEFETDLDLSSRGLSICADHLVFSNLSIKRHIALHQYAVCHSKKPAEERFYTNVGQPLPTMGNSECEPYFYGLFSLRITNCLIGGTVGWGSFDAAQNTHERELLLKTTLPNPVPDDWARPVLLKRNDTHSVDVIGVRGYQSGRIEICTDADGVSALLDQPLDPEGNAQQHGIFLDRVQLNSLTIRALYEDGTQSDRVYRTTEVTPCLSLMK